MVRTVICNPLIDKEVFQDVYKPTACCGSADGYVFLANAKNSINVHNVHDNTFPLIKTLQTTSIPIKLEYSDKGYFVLSLEKNNLNARTGPACFKSARIYSNWKSEPNPDSLRSRPNGYSSIGQYLSSYIGRHLIIDLPSKGGIQDASICQSNANVVMATSGQINIYSYKEIHGKDLIDFYHFISIDTNTSVLAISLFSTYVQVASSDEMIVFNLKFNYRIDDDMNVQEGEDMLEVLGDSSSLPLEVNNMQLADNEVSSKSLCVVWNISAGQGYTTKDLPNTNIDYQPKYCNVEPQSLKFKTIQDELPFQQTTLPTGDVVNSLNSIPGQNMNISIIDEQYWFNQLQCRFTVKYTMCIFKRFAKPSRQHPPDIPIVHSLLWAPTYIQGNDTGLASSFEDASFDIDHPLTINSEYQLVNLCCFFSTITKGYMYSLTDETPTCITSYSYSDKCQSALLTNGLLHILTLNGIETYTTRVYSCASNSKTLQDIMIAQQNLKKAYRTGSLLSYPGQIFDGSSSPRAVLPVKDFHYGTPAELTFESTIEDNLDEDKKSENEKDSANENLLHAEFNMERETYLIEEISQVCPSEQISICQIGVKNVQKGQMLCQTNSKLVAIKQADQISQKGIKERRKSTQTENKAVFSCCVFLKESEINLYKKMIDLIKGSEFASPPVYNLLLSEGHMLLRSAASVNHRHHNLDSYIKDSASKLGSFFARCKQSFEWREIQSYFSLAGLTLTNVLDRLMRKDNEEISGERYGPGIIHYLYTYLKDSDEISSLTEEHSNHILHMFSIVEPSSLSRIMLKSNLTNYSLEFAVNLLRSFRKYDETNSKYTLRAIDHVTMAVIHLRMCNPDQAESSLMRLKTKELLEICVEHHGIFLNKDLELTPIGQLVRRYMPDILSEMFVKLIERKIVDLFEAVKVLQTEELSPNSGVCGMLETLLMDKTLQELFHDASAILVKQYITNFKNGIFNDGVKAPHPHVVQSNGHFALRFEWLNKLQPFNGEAPKNQECSNRKKFQSNQSLSSMEQSPQGGQKEKEICSCCCCNRLLMKLQSLLCSSYNDGILSHVVVDEMTSDIDFPGIDSIRLLTWPRTGQVQQWNDYWIHSISADNLLKSIPELGIEMAVDFLIDTSPGIIISYARTIFTTDEKMWNVLLQSLLTNLRSDSCKEWNRETCTLALRGTLSRLSSLCLPSDFIQLLPEDGSLGFFIEFLEDCCRCEKALLTKKSFITSNAEYISSMSN